MRRDLALKNLIQPLAGEYGMHNNQPQREWGGGARGGQGRRRRAYSTVCTEAGIHY